MADNKRFVSYMYQYKNDEKHNNIGYARMETRGNQCKVFIHISFQEMDGKLLKAYMFYRKPAKYRFAYLGNILIDGGVGELKIKSDSNNVMNSDLTMDDMCGIIIYQNRTVFAACEWDQEPITHTIIDQIENLDLAQVSPQIVTQMEKEIEEEVQHQSILVVDYSGQPIEDEVAATTEVPPAKRVEPIEKDHESSEVELLQEEEKQQYENKDYYEEKMESSGDSYRNLVYEQELHMESIDIHKSQEKECPVVDCIEPTYGICGQGIMQPDIPARTMEQTTRFECHPIAQNIFRKFQRVYPFEDNEICNCVRLEPQDIGLLPIDAWVLGNNSFLLHGYYTYRHLIFGNIKTQEGFVYIIGVPGVYQNRESFMARMFGFEYFKCARLTQEKLGEFGYYYMPIQMG